MKSLLIFFLTLCAGLLLQSFMWQNFEFTDKYMWADQAKYIQTGDPREFDPTTAYGHPGTVAVEVAIALHVLFGASYVNALIGGMTLVNAVVIATCAVICYRLRPQSRWWFVATLLLLFNRLFPQATPPSAVVPPFIVLIFLLALVIYEQVNVKMWAVIGLGVTIGLSAATRTDVTSIIASLVVLFLIPRLGWRKLVCLVGVALAAFVVGNPFMWFHPVRQVVDLFLEVRFHYAHFITYRLPLISIILISPLALVGIGMGILIAGAGKRIPQPLPRRFLIMMLVVTGILSAILLSSRFQSSRYFFPLAFVWETFLPLLLFNLFAHLSRGRRMVQLVTVTLLVGGQAAALVHLVLIPHILFFCLTHHPFFCTAPSVIVW